MKFPLLPSALSLLLFTFLALHSIAGNPKEDGVKSNSAGIFSLVNNRNLLPNADFELGTSHWVLGKYHGGQGKITTDTTLNVFSSNAACISTSNDIDQELSDVQLFTTVKLKKMASYSVSFQAAATSACIVSVSLTNGGDLTYFEEVLILSAGLKTYGPFEFNCPADDEFAVFAINLGKTCNRLWIDNVALYEDDTENRFNAIIASGGINIILPEKLNELYIQLYSAAAEDLPVFITDQRGRIVKTSRIAKGIQEATMDIPENMAPGNYQIKIITLARILASSFEIR
ncbi:MAG: carbohydrate binding domain-containing protein [Cyclobacteriaceae bacterium]|nr:carbohydrate binding domain-containing protein [Cyclobacteriaceae bacterium]